MQTSSERNVNVLWVAESNFPIKSGIKVHTHRYYHLFYIRRGPVDIPIGDELYTLNDGEYFLAPPGTPHGMNEISFRMVRCYEVKFTVSSHRLEHLLAALPLKMPKDDFVSALIPELVEECSRGEPSSAAMGANYLLTLINYLYRHYGVHEEMVSRVIDTTGYSQISKDIVKYLETHYEREILLQEVGDSMGFNKNYICSVFKQDSGMTIGGCLTIIRIRKAAELISFSDMNLSQVAMATGFTNLSHFNRIFKKITGIPPGQYRRMFPADILLPGDILQSPEWLDENGFIYSVLGGKKLSAQTISIMEGLAPEQADDAQEEIASV